MTTDEKKQAYQDIWACQDACNARALVPMLGKAFEIAFEESDNTAARNSHPAVLVMLDKLAQLAGKGITFGGLETDKVYGHVLNGAGISS